MSHGGIIGEPPARGTESVCLSKRNVCSFSVGPVWETFSVALDIGHLYFLMPEVAGWGRKNRTVLWCLMKKLFNNQCSPVFKSPLLAILPHEFWHPGCRCFEFFAVRAKRSPWSHLVAAISPEHCVLSHCHAVQDTWDLEILLIQALRSLLSFCVAHPSWHRDSFPLGDIISAGRLPSLLHRWAGVGGERLHVI